MINIIKRRIRKRIALHYIYESVDTAERYAGFVLNAPIYEWRFRLKLVLSQKGVPIECLERLLRFACH